MITILMALALLIMLVCIVLFVLGNHIADTSTVRKQGLLMVTIVCELAAFELQSWGMFWLGVIFIGVYVLIPRSKHVCYGKKV